MEASSLRIGDLIKDCQDKKYYTVTIEILQEIVGGMDFYEPIQLNEEWLLKFGFELKTKGSYNCYQNNKKFVICMWVESYKIIGFEETGTCYYGETYTAIKYVHQLQNLYFALTGEELILKQ